MNLEVNATQRPWNFGIHGENRILIHAKNINDGWIADCGNKFEGGVNFENAELIVRAVNNFDSLLEACREAKKNIPIASYSWEILRQAIANATK